jgi:hypothetical protein
MKILNYVIIYVIFFILAYIGYYLFITNGQIKSLRGKTKKKKELSSELILFKNYYHIDIEKIGMIKVLRIVNFVNALLIAAIVTSVALINKVWLKLFVAVIIIIPVIWAAYYFLAKYLKHLERKNDNV